MVAVLQQPDGKTKLKNATQEGGMRPGLTKRGAIRGVYDGRFWFARLPAIRSPRMAMAAPSERRQPIRPWCDRCYGGV